VIHVTDRTHVHVRLRTLKLAFSHVSPSSESENLLSAG
jgi:hypothetical protein